MSAPAPLPLAIAAQTVAELRLTARRGENLLAMIGVPVGLLLVLGSVDVLPVEPDAPDRASALLPGILAVAIVATGLVNLGIATAYERSYGVLQRLGAAPLGVSGLIVAKISAVVLIEVILAVALSTVAAVAFGWRPTGGASLLLLVPAIALATAVFAGLGLALAGTLRAEAVLLLANVAFLLVIAVGGVVVPLSALPDAIAAASSLLPPALVRDVLAGALGGAPVGLGPWLALAAWTVAVLALAVRTFRWD